MSSAANICPQNLNYAQSARRYRQTIEITLKPLRDSVALIGAVELATVCLSRLLVNFLRCINFGQLGRRPTR
jgi:hypothetical protein